MSAIDVRDVFRVFSTPEGDAAALQGLSLRVAEGEVVVVLGPSGSGKSTLMRAIVGVQTTAGGAVTVLGLPAGTPGLRSRVAYTTQAPSVYGDLTLRENLTYFARVLGAGPRSVEHALASVGMEEVAGRVVRTFSAGQWSRASLATALLGEPELLVLDEPTVGLDPVLRRELWATFRSLAEQGTTLLVSSHVLGAAEAHCVQVEACS